MKKIIVFICIFIVFKSFSQTIKGKIIDIETSNPIQNASIYINGSSYGTISNALGMFELDTKSVFQPQVIISIINYETIYIDDANPDVKYIIKLTPKINELDEVVLEADKYSRSFKMKIFKEQFIGKSVSLNDFKILNEDEIQLNFMKSKKTLYASSDQPLKIINNYLGYEILYDLKDFEILFMESELDIHYIQQSYYSGTTFFKDISNGKEKYIKRRKKAYLGSSMHFIQSMFENKLIENNFKLYNKGFETKFDIVFKRKDTLDYAILDFLEKKQLVVVYENNNKRTDIHFLEKKIAITKTGNFFPANALLYNGFMTEQRNGLLLPLDFIFQKD